MSYLRPPRAGRFEPATRLCSRVGIAVALVAALAVAGGCHRRIIRWDEAGQFDRVVTHVAQSRFEPRHEAARAYANSLAALGDVEKARAVLLRDFRHGGELASLVALADLEASDGRLGIAAVNYARVMVIEQHVLQGRDDVCQIFRRRAAELLALDDAVAADHDMRRVSALCGEPVELTQREADAMLWKRISVAADRQARAQRALAPIESTRSVLPSALAKQTSPALTRSQARRQSASLDPEILVNLLVAEARGQLGFDLIDIPELRALVGLSTWEEFASVLAGMPAPEAAYVRARLAAVLSVPGAETTEQRQQLLAQGLGHGTLDSRASGYGWRLAALTGSAALVELALKRVLEAESDDETPRISEAAGSDTPSQPHWMLRASATGEQGLALLAMSRLRADRQFDAIAVQAQRSVLRTADSAVVVEEVRRALAAGRPWHALALAEASPPGQLEVLLPVVGTAISLRSAVCDENCRANAPEDRVVAEQVLGDEAVARLERQAIQAAIARHPPNAPVDACPTVEQLLAEPTSTALAKVVADAVRTPSSGKLAVELARAVESDASLACAGRYVMPLLAAGAYEVTAATLADRLGMAPELESSVQLELHSELALVAGQSSRARRLAIEAAALASEPRVVWARAAFFARRWEAREQEQYAWQQLLLHGVGHAAAEVEGFLLLRQLRDVAGGSPTEKLDVVRDAAVMSIERYVDGGGRAQRWAREDRLLEAIAETGWHDAPQRQSIVELLRRAGIERARHPDQWIRAEISTLGSEVGSVTEHDASEDVVPAFVRLDALAHSRLARLRSTSVDQADAVMLAVGLAVTGDVGTRGLALEWLAAHATTFSPPRRLALIDVLVQGGVAWPPDSRSGERLIPDGDLVYRLALGLDLDPVELRAKTRAWGSTLSRPRVVAAL